VLHTINIISILLVALAMAPALAHLLEFPGKKRLTKDAYLTVQPIYYPGFTVAGGIGEVGGSILVFVVLLLTPRGHAGVLVKTSGATCDARHGNYLLAVHAAGEQILASQHASWRLWCRVF